MFVFHWLLYWRNVSYGLVIGRHLSHRSKTVTEQSNTIIFFNFACPDIRPPVAVQPRQCIVSLIGLIVAKAEITSTEHLQPLLSSTKSSIFVDDLGKVQSDFFVRMRQTAVQLSVNVNYDFKDEKTVVLLNKKQPCYKIYSPARHYVQVVTYTIWRS